MKLLALIAAAAAGLAAPAAAAPLHCKGEATGAAGAVMVTLVVDGGRVRSGERTWRPPADPSSTPGAMLFLTSEYAQPVEGRLGPVTGLGSAHVVPLELAKAERALVGVSSNASPPIFKESALYRQMAGEVRSGRPPQGVPAGSREIAFTIMMPFVRNDPAAVPLLDSLEGARTVITTLTDPRGGPITQGRGLFWVNDKAGLEALTREAHGKALAAAKSSTAACLPPPKPPG